MGAAARRLRAVPRASEPVSEDAPHAACILEQARRAAYLKQVIAGYEEEKGDLLRQYEELADRYNAARAELSRWRAWAADIPQGGTHADR